MNVLRNCPKRPDSGLRTWVLGKSGILNIDKALHLLASMERMQVNLLKTLGKVWTARPPLRKYFRSGRVIGSNY